MSFDTWFKRYAVGYIAMSSWAKAAMRASFNAGMAYEKALAKKRKPKETK